MAEYLDLDGELKAVTKELKERADAGAGWMGRGLDDAKVGIGGIIMKVISRSGG